VSDLGAKRSKVHVIFNTIMVLLGSLSLVLPYNFQSIQSSTYLVNTLLIMSFACILVGFISINKFVIHTIFSFTFFFSSIFYTFQLLVFNINTKYFHEYINLVTIMYLISVAMLLAKALISFLKYKRTKNNFKKYNAGYVEWVVLIMAVIWNVFISSEFIIFLS
jgi:hypothetical membrane protein